MLDSPSPVRVARHLGRHESFLLIGSCHVSLDQNQGRACEAPLSDILAWLLEPQDAVGQGFSFDWMADRTCNLRNIVKAMSSVKPWSRLNILTQATDHKCRPDNAYTAVCHHTLSSSAYIHHMLG